MPRWEYTSARSVDFNVLGLDGWELVSVVRIVQRNEPDYNHGYFKRLLPPAPSEEPPS